MTIKKLLLLSILTLAVILIPSVMPVFAFSNGQAATVVLGQNTFTTNTAATTATGLNFPIYATFDSSGNLWVSDFNNNRILMYLKGTGFTNGEAATVVLGQNAFTTNTQNNGGRVASSLFHQGHLAFDSSGNLWVADSNNARVLMYPKGTGFTNGEAATVVLGQNAFTTITNSVSATNLDQPSGIAFDSSGNLWVSDNTNNRVLEYPKGTGFTNGEAATVVLGQNTFTTNTAATTATGLYHPSGIAFDSSGNLWVADHNNNRILMYPKGTGFTNGEAATVVLGQNTFTTNTAATTATGLYAPGGIALDSSGNLVVADTANNRVLMYFDIQKVPLPIPSNIFSMQESDLCIKNGHLICKINLNIFREIGPCYDQIDGPMCHLPKTMTHETLLEIQQEFPPLQQAQAGIPLKDIIAAKGNVLIMNDHRSSPASVTENTANSLLSNSFWHKFP